MATKLELLQEAGKRGLLPPEKMELLKEAQNRGLVGGGVPQEQPQQETSIGEEIARPILRAGRSIAAGIGGIGDIAQEVVFFPEALARGGARVLGFDVEPFDYSKVNTISPMIRQGFDEMTDGLTAPRNTTEEIVDIGSEIVGGGLGGAIKTVATKAADVAALIGKRALQKTTGITNKSKELIKAFEATGVNPTLANIAEGQGTKSFQNLVGNAPGGRGAIEKATQDQIDALTKQIAGITRSEGGTIPQAGKTIQEGAKSLKRGVEGRISKLYDDLDEFIPKEVQVADDLKPLVEEARGFKSADEFIASKPKLFHGTPDINKLKGKALGDLPKGHPEAGQAIYFTDNKNVAKTYADPKRAFDFQAADPSIIEARVDLKNPLVIDAKGSFWRKFKTEIEGKEIVGTRNLEKYAKDNGYDGLVVNNVVDTYNISDKPILGTNYAVFSPKQVKTDKQLANIFDKSKVSEGSKIPTNNLKKAFQDEIVTDALINQKQTSAALTSYERRLAAVGDESGAMPYKNIKTLRSNIGRKLQSGMIEGDEKGALKKLYGALSEDMKEAVVAQGGEKGLQAFNKANNAFIRHSKLIDKKIDPLIKAKTPSKVYDLLVSGTKQGGTDTRLIMRKLDPTQRDFVRGTVAREMGLANEGVQGAARDTFSPNKFLTEYNKMRKVGSERNIFTPEQNEAFTQLNKVIESLKETSKARQSSNNLPYMTWAGLGYILRGGVIGAGATVAGANITSKMMTNPNFIKWLAQTPKVRPAAVPKHLKQLSIIAGSAKSPELSEDILNYLESITIEKEQNGTK